MQVLDETENDGVMWGDEDLLHMIADRAWPGKRHRAWRTSKAVLDALSRNPGPFRKYLTQLPGYGIVRVFRRGPLSPGELAS